MTTQVVRHLISKACTWFVESFSGTVASHPSLHHPLSSTIHAQAETARSPSPSHRISHNPPSKKKEPQTCFVLPITSPLTLLQSMLASSSSSTSPHTTTLSPRTRYKPCGCSLEGSSSPCSRIMRSIVSASTRFVTWSQDTSVPVRVRPSTVMMRTFSVWGDVD